MFGVNHGVAESLALLFPVAVLQVVGGVLDETGHHVLARRRDGGVGKAGKDHVNVGPGGEVAVLGVVVGTLHVVDAG
jgi:hypothetical protein